MAKTDPSKPLCKRCLKRNAQVYYKGLCQHCYLELRQVAKNATPLGNLADKMAEAKTADDWRILADALKPTIEAVARGEVKASAAQAAMLKEIMSRAFGRVTKSQEEQAVPPGIIFLPTVGEGSKMQICPKCREFHSNHG